MVFNYEKLLKINFFNNKKVVFVFKKAYITFNSFFYNFKKFFVMKENLPLS